tara:strand:- start:1261 stop:1668 length:408 start_codon:yes stop_codon:yes gene_type:complete
MSLSIHENVYLNIYDLTSINSVLEYIHIGAYHSGIEIYGKEYGFNSSGVYTIEPQSFSNFKQNILLGTTTKSQNDINNIISNLQDRFTPDLYNPVKINCHFFANELSHQILYKPIPRYLNRLPSLFSCIPIQKYI